MPPIETGPSADRVEALEMRLAYQERALDELNVSVTAQWRVIDDLRRQVGRLKERLAEAEAAIPRLPDRPPPHY